jgi:predicted deacylase
MISYRVVVLLSAIACFAGCVTPDRASNRYCLGDHFLIDAQFEGGNFSSCDVDPDGNVLLTIRPEDRPPINESPWYSFRISPSRSTTVNVTLNFVDGYARYWPKVSHDGHHWRSLEEGRVTRSDDGESMLISLDVDHSAVWVSGGELLTPRYYDGWVRELGAHSEVTTQLLGRSVQGRPIYAAQTSEKSEAIILIGRQHPPEVTGAIALRPFVNAVLSDTPLAREFRERFSIIIIPLLNPDGVIQGHWRHNVNGVDLNRDWGPFTQPETQSVADFLEASDAAGVNFKLMLDFHSTRSDLFYTQLVDDFQTPTDFATVWLGRARERLPEYEFKHDARKRSDEANTKNYFFGRYGIPAITYELGDETDRQLIREVAPVFAEEMMRTMLEIEPRP